MRTWVVAVILAWAANVLAADDLTTLYERSGFMQTPRYDETVAYSKLLAKNSKLIHYTTFGKSPQGRDLPLLVVDRDGDFEPKRVRRDEKAVLMIQACIHAGESDGKDAGFMLLRDIVGLDPHAGRGETDAPSRANTSWLDHVTILFIPMFNVDGHEHFGAYNRINQSGPEEMGWRVTAQGLNLNRDYLKADSPEIRDWLRLYNAWNPDFFVDCHVTDGADYQYVLTYLDETHGNLEGGLTSWMKEHYTAPVTRRMSAQGYDLFPYLYMLQWPNPKAGIRSWVSTPRFSTGYAAITNRPSLLIETHMLKDYGTRVTATYDMLAETIACLAHEYKNLKLAIAAADEYTSSSEFRNDPFPLKFEPDTNGVMIDFKGIGFEAEKSDLTGGPWLKFNGKPETFSVKYLDKQIVAASAQLPEAYVIPPEWTSVTERLEAHGVEFTRLAHPVDIEVQSYRFENVHWQETPYEGHHPVTFELDAIAEKRTFPAGSVVVDMNQRRARVVAHMLEPDGPDSFVSWGFFDTIFEQKEYSESYVMEKMARDMLAKDEALRAEFEQKKKDTPDFAENPRWILDWFYQHTPYWDDRINVYPVGKVVDRGVANSLHG